MINLFPDTFSFLYTFDNFWGPLPRLAHDFMDTCLKKGAEARKFSISLGSLEYSGDLVSQLMKFSSKMEAVFKHLQQLVDAKSTEEGKFLKHFKIIQDKMTWYDKAEARPPTVSYDFMIFHVSCNLGKFM